jgi:hypothetical protein
VANGFDLPSALVGHAFAALHAAALGGPRVRVVRRPRASLTPAEREAVWSLIERSVQRDRRTFEDKLARIDEVALGYLPTDELCAFVAVDVVEVEHEGQTVAFLCSHWAFLDPQVRGCNLIHRVGGGSFLRYRARHPTRPVYWLFTASTFHSYLLLVRNFETFWPRAGVPWPTRERVLIEAAMRRVDDPAWDPEAGVLRRNGASRYREGVVDDEPGILQHPVLGPAVRFYREQNPRQVEGDSLVCLCPLSAANWWWCARASLDRSLRRKSSSRPS